jgi:hypothetical protein
MVTFANSVDTLFNNILNGSQAADRFLFSSAVTLEIASGAVTAPTQVINYIYSEIGTLDNLDTIGASNNRFMVLKAYSGHTIIVRSGQGNITTLDGNDISMSGNIMLMAWCTGSQWSVVSTGGVKNNFAAAADPGTGDDSAAGYDNGSLWLNALGDKAFFNVAPDLAVARWRQITPPVNRWSIRAAAATLAAVGIAAPTIANTPANANGTDGTYITLPTTSSSGNLGGFITASLNLVRGAHDFTAEWLVKTDATITTQRLWVGFIDADLTNVDTLAAGREFIGFRWSTVAADAGWVPVLNDGTTQNTGTAIGTVAASTAYKLRLRVVSGTSTVYFSVNDSAETAMTTNFPSSAQDLGMVCRCITTSAAIRLLNYSYGKVWWG